MVRRLTMTMRRERWTVREFGKPRTSPHSDSILPSSAGGSRELIEVRGQEHNASNATTREFKIVNFSGGGFATPTNELMIIQAPMRILKRPIPTTTLSNTFSPSLVPQTLAQREARSQEARERIFGPSKPPEQGGPKTNTQPPKPVLDAVHNSAGPDAGTSGSNSNASQGFGGKRGGMPLKL